MARYVIFGSRALFGIEAWLLGNSGPGLASVMLPGFLLALTALYTAYTGRQKMELRRSNEEVMRLATLAERERIGRDLHDLLGHTLSVVALKSELARKLIDRDIDAARTEIAEVERVARDSLQQVRTAVSGIRSTALSAEIVAATALLEAQGVKVKCETENVKLPHDRETALALSLREAATNIRRHAQASGVTIRVRKETAEVIVEVSDDGRLHGVRRQGHAREHTEARDAECAGVTEVTDLLVGEGKARRLAVLDQIAAAGAPGVLPRGGLAQHGDPHKQRQL